LEKANSRLKALDPERYCEVIPEKDDRAKTRTTRRTREEKVDGKTVVCTQEDRSDLFSVTTATAWTDTHATVTHAFEMGALTMDLERMVLERVISLCPLGHAMKIVLQDSCLFDEANRANSEQLTPEESGTEVLMDVV
jgi:hypothetical protein